MANGIERLGNIDFYKTPEECTANLENVGWVNKAWSCIQSYGTLFAYFSHRLCLWIGRIEAQMTNYTSMADRVSQHQLIVCIHGLNNDPTQFTQVIQEVKKRVSGAHIYAPHVVDRGNAQLDRMVAPILEKIRTWARTDGDKTLVLIGVSNGARISQAVEAALCQDQEYGNIKKIRFVSIVGANRGSSFADWANRWHLSRVMSENISQEMPPTSERNKQLKKDWKRGLCNTSHIERDYTFIASPHDWQVPNYSSTLMGVQEHNIKARYGVLLGHGHNSIVNASAKTVAAILAQAF